MTVKAKAARVVEHPAAQEKKSKRRANNTTELLGGVVGLPPAMNRRYMRACIAANFAYELQAQAHRLLSEAQP
jgi:hypothetical protein